MSGTHAALVAVFAALTMSLTACSGGGNGDASSAGASKSAAQLRAERADRKASKAISDSIMRSQRSSGAASQLLDITRKDADCVANGLVDKIGRKSLQRYGLLTKDLKAKQSMAAASMAAGDAKKATAVLFDCTNVQGMIKQALSKAGAIPRRMRSCIGDALGEASLRSIFTKLFQGKQTEAQQDLTGPMTRCALGGGGNG